MQKDVDASTSTTDSDEFCCSEEEKGNTSKSNLTPTPMRTGTRNVVPPKRLM